MKKNLKIGFLVLAHVMILSAILVSFEISSTSLTSPAASTPPAPPVSPAASTLPAFFATPCRRQQELWYIVPKCELAELDDAGYCEFWVAGLRHEYKIDAESVYVFSFNEAGAYRSLGTMPGYSWIILKGWKDIVFREVDGGLQTNYPPSKSKLP